LLSINGGNRILVPRGVNDYNTVVGEAQDDTDFSVGAFTRFSGGSISYYRHNSTDTFFTDRTNGGVTIGVVGGQFALGSMNGTPFTLQGSTFTPLTMTIGAQLTTNSQSGEPIARAPRSVPTQTPRDTHTALSASATATRSRSTIRVR
jgi:hypothetical protein